MKPHNEHQDFFDEIDNLEDLIDEQSKRDYEK